MTNIGWPVAFDLSMRVRHVARDITERFERDRTARRRLRELEKALDEAGSAPRVSGP